MNVLVLDNASGVIALPAPGGCWGRMHNVGAAQPSFSTDLLRTAAIDTPRLIIWSGSQGESLFEDDPRTWGQRGWEALARACDEISRELDGSLTAMLFRTHARHVLSDIPSCARFAKSHGDRFGLVLDPASMLTDSMAAATEDHLHRMLEGAAALPNLAAVLLSDALGPHAELARHLVQTHLPATLPIVRSPAVPPVP